MKEIIEKVKVVSYASAPVVVKVPEMSFARRWPSKGASIEIDKNTLNELIYNEGFKYLIDNCILYIEDMNTKIDLGLEPVGAEKPVNLIVLSDKDKKTYFTTLTLMAFKEKIQNLTFEQLNDLADYAIKNKLADIDKCKVLKKACGRDIIKTIQLSEENKTLEGEK